VKRGNPSYCDERRIDRPAILAKIASHPINKGARRDFDRFNGNQPS
jgi:hypothetical protein